MEMRTRILPRMLNTEVEAYLERNDIIIVPVGTIEMHGGFPLDVETVISEAVGLKMAEACDGLVLTGLQYFYAGATASGRGTTQVSVRQGIDYLGAIARSLLRQGFKRQIYISLHGPALMTCSPMVRDFFDETGVPILYIDMTSQLFGKSRSLFMTPEGKYNMDALNGLFVGGYQIMGRLEDVPLTTEFFHTRPQTCAPFNDLFGLATQSGSIGYCFKEREDHTSTPAIPDEATRAHLGEVGADIIEKLVENLDVPHIVEQMKGLKEYTDEVAAAKPWMPSAFNNRK